jgi:aminoglycoside phosphotransferase (APT) family kinase protein
MDARQRAFAARISEAFPDLSITTLAEMPHLGWGGDSDAWLVSGDLIMRFPRTAEVAEQLAVEARVLPQLAPTLPLAIPAFSHVARDAPGAPPRFAGYPLIRGEPLMPALLNDLVPDEAERAALASALGGFLARLHAFPLERALACGVAEAMREPERTRALYERVRELVYPRLSPPLRVWTDHLFGDALARPDLWDYTPALVHGDLSGDHILFDRATRTLAGIIDFGDMGVGDPLGDFVGLADYGEVFLAAALAAYPAPDTLGPLARDRLTFYRQRLPFIALAWGAEQGDEAALAEGMAHLRAVMAAGTRG